MSMRLILICFLILQLISAVNSFGRRQRSLNRNRRCNGTRLLTGPTGSLSSPNYPQNYGHNSDCSWKIKAPPGTKFVVLQFDSFKTEGCSYDYVEIHNGDSPASPLIKKLCGNKAAPFRVIVNGPSMFVQFRSDGSVSYKGFRAVYTVAQNTEDVCDNRWEQSGNSSYKFCRIPTSWVGALKVCQNMGANIVKITTDLENTFLFNLQKRGNEHTYFQFWIGLTRGPHNRFHWLDGSRPNYTKWAFNQPNNYRGQEHCGVMKGGYRDWNDLPCDDPAEPSFVCETEKCKRVPLFSSNSDISSSSIKDSNHSAKHGILANSSSIWCPQSNSSIEWLDVDLGAPYFICGVAAVNDVTMGNRSSVTWYQVYTSLKQFTGDPRWDNTSKELRTDVNRSTVVVHEFRRLARYVRFNPVRSVNWPCMKVEVYGGEKVPSPEMAVPLVNKTVEHTKAAELRCIANGHPFPSYSWTKNGSSVIPNGVLSQENTVLKISSVNWEDSGLYACTATNLLGSVTSSAYLTVHVKPKDLKFKPQVNGLKGSDVVLSCQSSAVPVPSATWVNDRIDLSSGRYLINTALIPGTNKLVTNITIRNASFYDSGFYKCRFWNYGGTIEGSINLDVVEGCSDVVFDFEDGAASLKDWGRTGTAFNSQPIYRDNVRNRNGGRILNYQGDYWIGTYENRPGVSSRPGSASGDGPQGSLTSPEFQITGASVSFLIGGGYHSTTAVQLLVGGRVVRTSSGNNHERFVRKSWNVQQYVGRKARLRLIDFYSGWKGHINFDDFRGSATICQGCSQPLGMTNGRIPDFALTASSMWDSQHGPKYGRLYTLHRDGHVGSWSSKRNVIGQWLQVDLGTVVMVTKIATQGRHSNSWVLQWVKQYTIEFSENGTSFQQYANNKIFPGNSDSNTIVENNFSPPIRGRFIRIYPRSWHNHISLRMELYGCPPKPAPPKILGLPKLVTKLEGSAVSLHCFAEGFPYIDYKWIKRKPSNKLTTTTNGPKLVLTNVTENNEGVYACVASNSVGNDSFDVRLNVHTFPLVIRGMIKTQIIVTGKVTILICEGKGNPLPTIAWLKNGEKIKKSNRLTLSSSTSGDKLVISELQITDIKYEDSGVYTCVIDNTVGGTNSNGSVLVHGPPQFTLTPRNHTIVKGKCVNLSCAASAVPTPRIRWKLNGKYLIQDAKITQNGTLMIKNADNNKLYEGIYTCEASNSFGTKSSTAQLTVYERPWFKTIPKRSVNVAQTQNTVFHCDAVGDPPPKLEWRKDGVSLETTERIIFQGNKQILILQQLRRKDSGLYQCVAKNIAGNAIMATNLTVFGQPKINKELTRKQVDSLLGNPVNVICSATNPLPVHYTWTKDGEEVKDSDNVKVHNNILVVTPRQSKDFGVYVCHVSNIAGRANYTIEIVERAKMNISYAAHGTDTSNHKSAGPSAATLVPLIVLIIILLVAVAILAYRHLQLKKQSACSKRDTIGLVTYDIHKDENLLPDEHAEW